MSSRSDLPLSDNTGLTALCSIHEYNIPGFWPVLYKRLHACKAGRAQLAVHGVNENLYTCTARPYRLPVVDYLLGKSLVDQNSSSFVEIL